MSRILTGDKLIESVRLRTMVPDDTSVYTDDKILDIIDEEMQVQVLDKLIALHGENLTVSVDVDINDSGVYDIPYRALGNKLRDVSLISAGQIRELSQISIGELPDYNTDYSNSYITQLFYVESNQVKLVNPNLNFEKLRIRYYLRPNYLTKVKNAGIISSVATDDLAGTVTYSLSQVGKNFSTTDLYDIVLKKTPNKIVKFDLDPTDFTKSNTTGTITFNQDDIGTELSKIGVGDYITLAEETPVPNIPTEMHPLLAQAAAVNILESLTDSEALRNAENRLDKIARSVQFLIDDRVELAPKKIKPRHGTLSRNRTNRRGDY